MRFKTRTCELNFPTQLKCLHAKGASQVPETRRQREKKHLASENRAQTFCAVLCVCEYLQIFWTLWLCGVQCNLYLVVIFMVRIHRTEILLFSTVHPVVIEKQRSNFPHRTCSHFLIATFRFPLGCVLTVGCTPNNWPRIAWCPRECSEHSFAATAFVVAAEKIDGKEVLIADLMSMMWFQQRSQTSYRNRISHWNTFFRAQLCVVVMH